ncbi:helix-turn-helix domain-containing protein [uncultured Robinsoniella sp.]|uniref:helix-turn-helix domain-containing protein n=1 Tax=uncultured Robinsoniella sp. TaxID=904190 RepID=UPI00374F350E
MSFGSRIKALRISKGLMQKDIAKYLNTSVTTISSYENDRSNPDITTITKLAQVFDITYDYLFGLTDIKAKFQDNYSIKLPNSILSEDQNKTLSSEDMIFINKIAKCLLSEKNRI